MTSSSSDYAPGGSSRSLQQEMGTRLHGAIDHLADTTPELDSVAGVLERVTAPVAGKSAPRSVRDFLNGTWLGHPLHPVIVMVPLGAWTLTTVFDVLGEERAADLCLAVGLLTAGDAVITGAAQWNNVTDRERPRRVGVVHAALNLVTTALYTGSWVLRRKGHREAGVALAAIGMTTGTLSGYLGGYLTYTLGVGVDEATTDRPAASDHGDAAGPNQIVI